MKPCRLALAIAAAYKPDQWQYVRLSNYQPLEGWMALSIS